MFDILWSWEFWVIVVIVFVFALWISSRSDKAEVYTPIIKAEQSVKIEESVSSSLSLPEINTGADYTPHIPGEVIGENTPPQYVRNVSTRSKGEQECKEALERIYSPYKFSTVRPRWLMGPKGSPLELDLFNEELGIAVEYNGEQHYRYVPKFHRNGPSDLAYQSKCDNIKVDLCDKNGVYLITVPYNVPVSNIENYIRYYLPDMVVRRNQAARDRKY